jgi:lysophospholipase L1-like esterase
MGRTRRRPAAVGVLAVVAAFSAAVVACSSSTGPAGVLPTPSPSSAGMAGAVPSTKYPNALVVLGHSGTTGANSDPASPGHDARENSWATGENPDVDSIYTRLLRLNPAVRGHNANFGVDGTNVGDLDAQLVQALALKPLPDLFMIQAVDNDLQCDGTDPDNYPKFAQRLTAVLTEIVAAAPKAIILLVSSPPGTVDNYGHVVEALPQGKQVNTGDDQCAMFDDQGRAVPAHWRYQEQVILGYHAQLASVCVRFSHCRYDGGALYRMKITARDLAPDAQHLSVSGHRKQAALEWRVLGFDS